MDKSRPHKLKFKVGDYVRRRNTKNKELIGQISSIIWKRDKAYLILSGHDLPDRGRVYYEIENPWYKDPNKLSSGFYEYLAEELELIPKELLLERKILS